MPYLLLKQYHIYQQIDEDLCLWMIQAHPCWAKPEQQHYHLWVFRRTWAACGLPGACGYQGPDCPSTTGRPGDQPYLSIWDKITASRQEVRVVPYTHPHTHCRQTLYNFMWSPVWHFTCSDYCILVVSICTDAAVLVPSGEIWTIITICYCYKIHTAAYGVSSIIVSVFCFFKWFSEDVYEPVGS